jgi:phosphoglycolate phosphatase-like HAD superfamily hydrolase
MINQTNLNRYATLVFDCDGVLLNSNIIKTEAFYEVGLAYGDKAATSLVEYHQKNGGLSRNIKFKYFIEQILKENLNATKLNALINQYASIIIDKLLCCEISPNLHALRKLTAHSKWMVVSGGAQAELRIIFKSRNIDFLFDGGIFGSPDDKDDILITQSSNNNLMHPALFLGDSKYDHEVALRAGLDFIFVSNWTEFDGWKEYCERNKIKTITTLTITNEMHFE